MTNTASVRQLLDDLVKSIFDGLPWTASSSRDVNRRAAVGLSELIAQTDQRQLTRRARTASFEILLSHRSELTNVGSMSVFDRLLAKSYDLRLNRRSTSESASLLVTLVGNLRQTPLPADCESVLRLLLALADTGVTDDRPIRTTLRRTTEDGSHLQSAAGKHSYEQFPRQMFHSIHNVTLEKSVYDIFDAKLFERCPGFATDTAKLSCQRFCSPLSNTVAPTLYGALSHPLKDAWQLDVRLDFPELLEESPAPYMPFEHPRRFAASSSVPLPAVDEDEGFVETTETPSSGCCSFGRVGDVDHLWNAAALEGEAKPRYTTWETHGSYYVPREKPLLSEGGSKAIDKVIDCLHQEMSLVQLDLQQTRSIIISAAALHHDAISVLVGIPSRTFTYDETCGMFTLAPVAVSGLSTEAVSRMLISFGDCGRAYRTLESACRVKKTSKSLVQRALFEAIGSYLRHYEESVLDLRRDEDGRLLRLVESTSKLRRQICLILRLCFLDVHCVDEVFLHLPRGIHLLRHLYDAVESNPGDVVDDRVVVLAFFLAASDPYIQYVRFWAFGGRRLDPYDEFPVAEEADFLQLRDDQFWKKSLQLSHDTEDPVLSNLSSSVFVCGKSLHLLRLCCPQHHLFSSSMEAPSLEIAFSEERQMELISDNARYHNAMRAEGNRLTSSREVIRLLQERDKEELFRHVQMVTKLCLMKHRRDDRLRREAESAKKRSLMADIKAQIELRLQTKNAELAKAEAIQVSGKMLVEMTPTSTLEGAVKSVSVEQLTTKSRIGAIEAEPPDVATTLLDSNMNPAVIDEEATESGLDPNANPDMKKCSDVDVVLRKNAATGVVEDEDGDRAKGIKRKQDRDSIDFDAGGVARRHPLKLEHGRTHSDIARATESRAAGVLVEGSTFAVLRTRGRSAHGHSSDSTIQKLMYGDSTGLPLGRSSYAVSYSPKKAASVKEEKKSDFVLPFTVLTNLRVEPYTAEFVELDRPPMSDIFKSPSRPLQKSEGDVSPATLFRLPLSAVIQKCLAAPLRAQISCVDCCLLDYFLVTLRAEEHLSALKDYFFMQDGEFGQTLCDLLFERLSSTTSPNELLNPVVLNPILSGALAFSSAANPFSDNLGFVVKFMPATLHQNSPSALNCLQLSYHVEWPLNILISSDDLADYERIFSFVLQMRRCSWSLGNVYTLLKELDSTSTSFTASPHFRSLQFFRHEMLHFVRSLYEYVGVQVFQVTWFNLRHQITAIRNLDELLNAHSKYLRHITFRCLLHNKATPVMKVVQDLFAIVLKFRSQLLAATWSPNPQTKFMEVDCFSKLCSSFVIFRDYSTFLYKVISKLAQRGYQTHLMEFLINLDFNDYYSTLSSQSTRNVSSLPASVFSNLTTTPADNDKDEHNDPIN